MCVHTCAHISACHMSEVPAEARRECRIPSSWAYKWLWVWERLLGSELWSSANTVHALNCWTISPTKRWKVQLLRGLSQMRIKQENLNILAKWHWRKLCKLWKLSIILHLIFFLKKKKNTKYPAEVNPFYPNASACWIRMNHRGAGTSLPPNEGCAVAEHRAYTHVISFCA